MSDSAQRISIQPGYILVERPQDFEVVASEQQAILKAISDVCDEAGCRKVLVLGAGTKVKLSVLDIFELGKAIGQLHLWVAIVELHDAAERDVRFLENVGQNRGGPIQFFDNEQDAKDWLGIT